MIKAKEIVRAITEWIGARRIRTKMIMLLFIMAFVSISLFGFLWRHQLDAADLIERMGIVTWFDSEGLVKKASGGKIYSPGIRR